MKTTRFPAILIAVVLGFRSLTFAADVTSPDGQLVATFQTQPNGQLVYSVAFHGKPLMNASALSLELRGQRLLGKEVKVVAATPSSGEDSYSLLAGKASEVDDRYNALQLDVTEVAASARQMTIEARAYNDAIAFRYVVPKQTAMEDYRLIQEHTEFRVSKDATAYALELPNYRSMYESEYVKLPISSFCNQGGIHSNFLIGLPVLLDVPGVGWMAITEADLRDNAAMYVTNPSPDWTGHWFESRIAPDIENPDFCVTSTLPHHSAWRVLLIGDEPGRLIESNVITSLNPECAIQDTSWIHPGKASWNWWSGSGKADRKPAYDTDTMKYYVDFAAKSGFPYMLIDAGWSAPQDITQMNGRVDIPDVVSYAAAKGVKVWIWLGARDVENQMDDAFPLYEKWGVAGVKIDFIERDDQGGIAWYYRVAQLAAQHHLMVDFHGATKPTGMSRTYPNVLGYEAVLGMEQSKAGMRDNPEHEVTLPFTRMLTGPMDYTPGAFDNVTREEFQPSMDHPMVMGTRSHQLAMYAVYEAPFQMVSDNPTAYDGQPEFQFIKDVPTTWDQTRVLAGLPGEFITVARRKGNDWYIGSMTNWTPRQIDIPLDFLGSGSYSAEIYSDAADADKLPKHVTIATKTVDGTQHLQLNLAPGGGAAIRLRPGP